MERQLIHVKALYASHRRCVKVQILFSGKRKPKSPQLKSQNTKTNWGKGVGPGKSWLGKQGRGRINYKEEKMRVQGRHTELVNAIDFH